MHEVAKSASGAFSHLVLTTTGFAEIGDWRQLAIDRQSVVPSVVQIRHGFGRVFLFAEFDVDVTNQVIAQVVANVHLFHLAVFVFHFQEDVLEKVIVVLLLFDVRDGGSGLGRRSRVLQVAITILEDDGLGESGFVVEARTGRAVTASADFDVKRTVDLVLFRPEN